MSKSKGLTDFTNFFSPNKFNKNDKVILNSWLNWEIKIVEIPTNNEKIKMYPRLDNGMQYRLNEINRLKDYFFWQNLRKRNTQ